MYAMLYSDVCLGVVHLIFLRAGERVSAGTGFMVENRLFTNNHVIQCPHADSVLIRTLRHDRKDSRDGILVSYEVFMSYLYVGSPENEFDYAVLEVPDLVALGLYNFRITHAPVIGIGREFAILGYPLDHYNLTLHRGIISSVFEQARVEKFQLDGSVNNGNSGGPLVELTTGEVVAIITRKDTGLTKMFKELRRSLTAHADNLEQLIASGATISHTVFRPDDPGPGGTTTIGGSNLDDGFAETARALVRLCSEIERSANTGIGYAYSIRHLAEDYPNLAWGEA